MPIETRQSQGNPLQLLLGVLQYKQGQQQLQQQAEISQRSAQQQDFQNFVAAARRSVDPTQLRALTKVFAPRLGTDEASLMDIASKITPDADVLPTWAATQGVKSATGVPTDVFNLTPDAARMFSAAAYDRTTGANKTTAVEGDILAGIDPESALGKVMKTRLAAGVLPGALAQDTAMSNIPETAFRKAFDISTHQALGVGEAADINLRREGLDLQRLLGLAGVENQRGQLNEERIHNRATEALGQTEQDVQLTAAKARGGLSANDLPALLSTSKGILDELDKPNTSYTPGELRIHLQNLKEIHAAIRKAGGTAPDFDVEQAVKDFSPNLVAKIRNLVLQRQ